MANMTRQQRRYNKNPLRRKIPGVGAQNRPTVRTPIGIVSAVLSVNQITVTFDTAVFSPALPGWSAPPALGSDQRTVSAVTQVSPVEFVLTMSGAVLAASDLTIPFEDPGFRNTAGGYVRPPTFTLT